MQRRYSALLAQQLHNGSVCSPIAFLAQVVRITAVEDTESAKLFKTSIDLGNGESRQVGEALTPAEFLNHHSMAVPQDSRTHLACRHCMLGSE